MIRLLHPRTGRPVDVPEHEPHLLAYYRGEGYIDPDASPEPEPDPEPEQASSRRSRRRGQPVEQLPPGEYAEPTEPVEHSSYGEPLTGIAVPLGEIAERLNDPDLEPGDQTDPDSGEQPAAGSPEQ